MTRAKRNALALLANHFVLRTNDLAELHRKRTPTESDRRAAQRTLALLFAEGLVHRIPYLDLDHLHGGATYAYGLSDSGIDFVLSEGISTHATKTFDDHSQRTLDHELEISLFHIKLSAFCEAKGLKLYWRQTDLKKSVHPDALFAITEPRKEPGRNTNWFFLEIERAKLSNYVNGEPQILRKLKAYYDYFATTQCGTDWKDFTHFRVLIVLRTDERRQNLLASMQRECSHRLFWLTVERLYREHITGEIFLTPKDYREACYSFADL